MNTFYWSDRLSATTFSAGSLFGKGFAMTGSSLRATAPEFAWIPTRQVTSDALRAARGESVLPPSTSVHPLAVAVPVAAFEWLVLASWDVFGSGDTTLVLAVVTFLSIMFFGLLIGGGWYARDAASERSRSFEEFLDGDVEIETGRIPGRTAMWQIATMPVALAVGGTIIIACARCAGF
jgi:hypothetical protein